MLFDWFLDDGDVAKIYLMGGGRMRSAKALRAWPGNIMRQKLPRQKTYPQQSTSILATLVAQEDQARLWHVNVSLLRHA